MIAPTKIIIGLSFPSLFGLALSLAVFCFFPIRNSVPCQTRPRATWGLIGANLVVWAASFLANTFGYEYGLAGWFDPFVFANDFSKPWTLVTSLFVNQNLFQLLLSLWLLYLLAPVLEERLKWPGLLLVYLGGGAATAALCGILSNAIGTQFVSAGMTPSLFALLGFYLVLYPFEDFIFAYNFLFFVFAGTVAVATFYLVAFALLLHVLSAVLVGAVVLQLMPWTAAIREWFGQSVSLVGLGLGFLAGALKYGLGGFFGQLPAGVEVSPADRMVQRALSRLRQEEDRAVSRPLTRHERAQSRQALGGSAPPEEIEAFAEQCLTHRRDPLLETAYVRFRGRFPERCFGPGLQAAVAQRFEQTDRTELATDAYRLLVQSHGKTPVAASARFRLARILTKDPTATDEAIELIEDLLAGNPTRETADEARGLLDHLIETSGRGQTYSGLSPHKPFHFSTPPEKSAAPPTPSGVPIGTNGLPIGRAAAELLGEGEAPPTPSPEPPEKIISPREVLPDSQGHLISDWGRRTAATTSEVAAAMAAAHTFAVILLPGKAPLTSELLGLLGELWTIGPEEAAEELRRCRGVLLDDAPSGRAVVLARKLHHIGVPVSIVPLSPDLAYATCEDVLEFAWSDSTCTNVTARGRRSFGWDQVRLANVGRLGLPGAGQAFRLVLDLFVADPHCLLRFWESTLNYLRSSLGGNLGVANSLQPLVAELDRRTPHALRTPSFRAMVKKTGPPLDFHSPAELDHYDRWFLYAAYGKYSAGE